MNPRQAGEWLRGLTERLTTVAVVEILAWASLVVGSRSPRGRSGVSGSWSAGKP